MKKISRILPEISASPARKKVAAYARVSVESEDEMRSLSAQISFYQSLIRGHFDWDYAGIYVDSGISGTRVENRGGLLRLIADCERGMVDIILTKSVSRFARNTVNLLEIVRHLREIGVEVRFERENINSLDGEGELMLTVLSSFAQEESRSISENVKWGIRRGFERGKMNSPMLYGYRSVNGQLKIEPKEAETVRLIYDNFLKGFTARQTEEELARRGVLTLRGNHFSQSAVRAVLRQEKYTGRATLQRWYIENHITHKKRRNQGELPMYIVENSHEPIIEKEVFDRVQAEINRRREEGIFASGAVKTNCFTSRIRCGICGKNFRRYGRYRKNGERAYSFWQCSSKALCENERINEETLKAACAKAMALSEFDETRFCKAVSLITAKKDKSLELLFFDNRKITINWGKI